MENVNNFGNTPWYVFVASGYIVSGLCLIGYAIFSTLVLKKSVQSLKDEGFMEEKL
jgi:hypothetical protein